MRPISVSKTFNHFAFSIAFAAFALLSTKSLSDSEQWLFDLATSGYKTDEQSSYGIAHRWKTRELKIGVYVEGKWKADALGLLNDSFEADRILIQNSTGIDLVLGLWGDENPSPSIFVLVGEADEILRRSSYIAERFDVPTFAIELNRAFEGDLGLCNSHITLGEDRAILRAIITVDLAQRPRYCLRRQLLTAFGFFGDLPAGVESILATDQEYLELTAFDLDLLSKLYSKN
jgi:hypothetical protein